MWEEKMKEGQFLVQNRKYPEAIECFQSIMKDYEGLDKPYYWALKHLGDLNGFLYAKNYMAAIDIYQKIITDYEGEDGLYEWCQIDMAKTYLLNAMENMSTFEDMIGFLEPMDNETEKQIHMLKEKREDFLMERAEKIYKSRL